MKIEDVRSISLLGFGIQGVVYSARPKTWTTRGKSLKNAPFVLKKRLLTSRDAQMTSHYTSSALRELTFFKEVANRYPDSFSELFDWKIEEASLEMKEEIRSVLTRKNVEIEPGEIFTHMLTTLSARKEGDLASIYKTLTHQQRLSLVSQVSHALDRMRRLGFSHNDVWMTNIGYIRVPMNSQVSIYRKKIPTFGYIWSLIDYGNVIQLEKTRNIKKRDENYEIEGLIGVTNGQYFVDGACGPDSDSEWSEEFISRVKSSIEWPIVRKVMRETGLPAGMAMAILNLNQYLWLMCNKISDPEVYPLLSREELLKMADLKSSYRDIAIYFGDLAKR